MEMLNALLKKLGPQILMTLTGQMLIGATAVLGSGAAQHAINPATGERLEPGFPAGSSDDVARAAELARAAFDPYRAASWPWATH
ncbi:hypothetical protein G6F31_018567 [Rhizopus arrhizus]|nr:hypothetical protein G6F31_018567 [Rhizopus arrhizus]